MKQVALLVSLGSMIIVGHLIKGSTLGCFDVSVPATHIRAHFSHFGTKWPCTVLLMVSHKNLKPLTYLRASFSWSSINENYNI